MHRQTEKRAEIVRDARWIIVIVFLLTAGSGQTQTDCGIVDNVSYPIDTAQFTLAQDYAVASPRHQGRFHTGEDWYGGRNVTVGQPVRAAARGRVVYSYVLGWGRDGGVVILEHNMPDGSIVYTQYGHLMETETYTFPPRLTCVEQGDVLGAIGDVRPAPHIHFEVRVANPDTPGPGYTRPMPFAEGFRDPSKFIANNQAWLNLAHRWHISVGNETPQDESGPRTPPFVLSDNSLLYLDGAGTTLRRATADGRVLWRLRLETPAVYIEGFQGTPLVYFTDGRLRSLIDLETGALNDGWQIDTLLASAPTIAGEWLLFPTPDDALIALDGTRRQLIWRIENVPPALRTHVADSLVSFTLGWLTADYELLVISSTGQMVDRARLREAAHLATAPEGDLLVYGRGGLWRVDSLGEWSPYREDVPHGGASSAVLAEESGLFVFDGTQLVAYSGSTVLWNVSVPTMTGLVELQRVGEQLLLTSNHGQINLMGASGRLCNFTSVYGTDGAQQWLALGSDGVLRVAIADQILGLDWGQFAAGCA